MAAAAWSGVDEDGGDQPGAPGRHDPEYLDRNYAGILVVWDRVFGTYAHETHRPTYGLTTPVVGFNPVRLQYREYAHIARDVWHARGVRTRLGHVFAPPGWTP